MTMPQRFYLAFARRAGAFARAQSGSVTVEAAVMAPLILAFFGFTFMWFDAFRVKNEVLKATYSVSDMISREQQELPEQYFAGLHGVFDYMIRSNDETTLRVTTVKCTKDCDDDAKRELELCWSWASPGLAEHTATTFGKFEKAIPLMVLGDTVVVTEGSVEYTWLFDWWLEDLEIRNTIVTRPRFAAQVALGDQRCYGDGGTSGGGEDDEGL